ncbi:hypothetical protein ACQFX9_28210 [Aliinostoc sp. HNIBRCY26]|uniref:hypothetical protein n=1 Tax=Aliinostoc sp. HNIBRCY26 TaxID=3418997 RepID=UPI003CFFCD26
MNNPLVTGLKIYIEDFCCNNFTLKIINKIFSDAGFTRDESIQIVNRRPLVNSFLDAEEWSSLLTVEKLIKVIESILYNPNLSNEEKDDFRFNLQNFGFQLDGNKVISQPIIPKEISFKSQFPLGLPFGKLKPGLAIKLNNGTQILKFEWENGIGIINFDVYPDLTYQKLISNFNMVLGTDENFKIFLRKANQTKYEEQFFLYYANFFKMTKNNVPFLIPQAWIQWHSQSKKSLNSKTSLNSKDIYRVDFVAFWKNKRFAIFIDDISHYATPIRSINDGRWLASEEEYSNNLRQDRKLMIEGWNVIRFSNWEIKHKESLNQIMIDLSELIDFEFKIHFAFFAFLYEQQKRDKPESLSLKKSTNQ